MDSTVRQGQVANALRALCSDGRAVKDQPEALDRVVSIAAPYAWALYHDIEVSLGAVPIDPQMLKRRDGPGEVGYFL